MKANNKLFASVAGVCITAAVVIGAVLGASGRDTPPAQQPAGAPTDVASTVTVTASPTASPTSDVAVAVSPSKKPTASRKKAAVVNQGDPVTDPQPGDQTSTEPQPPSNDLGTGSIDEGGVRRAPAPSEKIRRGPSEAPPPLGPSVPITGQGD